MTNVPIFWRYVLVFLVSMVPIIELRGAIPIGVAWGLETLPTYLVCVIGNILPVPFILLFIRTLLRWMQTVPRLSKIADWVNRRAEKNSVKVMKYASVGLFLFVAIPLPGTGAWTGALVAALLDMRMRYALPSIFFGVLTAGFIMTFASELISAIF